ncbi:hypothetical protein [Pseudomonas sp. NPDC086251]|uniref:hypothetical protein n=1 Tax=Pseudomonas sp. NPDC086251 TaxID=3364431 RepID=UPI00383846B6
MRHLSSLKLARAVSDPDNSGDPSVFLVYRVFGCVQSKDANLKDLPQPAVQRFAVINPECVDDDVFQILEDARDVGALAPVKLMVAHEDSLYLFLDEKVGSTTVAAIESLWSTLTGACAHRRMAVHFASESEIYAGRSDYSFSCGAQEILESETLGLIPSALSAIDTSSRENDRSKVTEVPQIRRCRDGLLISSLSIEYYRIADLLARSEFQDMKMTEKKPRLRALIPIQTYSARFSQCVISGLPGSRTVEYCQRKERLFGESELEMLKPKKKRHAKERPQSKAFGGTEEAAIARAKPALLQGADSFTWLGFPQIMTLDMHPRSDMCSAMLRRLRSYR